MPKPIYFHFERLISVDICQESAILHVLISALQSRTNSAFTLPTSEPCQTGLVSFSKADISRTTDTCQVPISLLTSAFENGTKPVWHSSEVGSVNAL